MEVPANERRKLAVIPALGTTQTPAWALSYCLSAIQADPIARDLGISTDWFFAAFSRDTAEWNNPKLPSLIWAAR